jgi:hypothetical protein
MMGEIPTKMCTRHHVVRGTYDINPPPVGGEIVVDAAGIVRKRSRGRVGSFSPLRSAQCRCLRSLSPRPKHPVVSPSPLSRRIHSSLPLAAAARAQTAPRARANRTSPRSCCLRRSKVEDG